MTPAGLLKGRAWCRSASTTARARANSRSATRQSSPMPSSQFVIASMPVDAHSRDVTQPTLAPLTRTFAGPEHQPFGRRLRAPRGARVPLIVVTGFLGAGKTTLIRNLLGSPEGADSLVIVNE